MLVLALAALTPQPKLRAGIPSSVLAPQPPPLVNYADRLVKQYDAINAEHHFAVAAVQCGMLSGGSDVISQSIHGLPLSIPHVAAFAILEALLTGALAAAWLQRLEYAGSWQSGR